MKKRIFGFDLGIASIGWAVVDFDKENFNPETGEIVEGKIIKSGVRIFPVAENPKDGTSLAAPRRENRLSRRTIRRKARRMDSIKNLFVALKLAPSGEYLEQLYAKQIGGDVWNLRIKALSGKLEKDEILRVLTHMAKHRGFKSYRKATEEEDAEGGKVLQAIAGNADLFASKGYRTMAELVVNEKPKMRNRGKITVRKIDRKTGQEKEVEEQYYGSSIPRKEIIRELELIFEKQKEYGIFTQKLYDDFSKIAFRHWPVGSVEEMVGLCTFEKDQKRAPKEAPSAEFFVAWSKINNLKVNGRFLNSDERAQIFKLLKDAKEVKYTALRKNLKLADDVKFDDINYKKTTKKGKDGAEKEVKPEDVKFYALKGWHKLKNTLDDEVNSIDIKILDQTMNVITCQKNDADIEKGLQKIGLKQEYIDKLKKITSQKFINLSLKALYKINPYLEQGLKYNEACEKNGYDFKDTGEKLVEKKGKQLAVIPQDKLTTVPVVNRTVAQFRKVYNAIVKAYGEPDQINLEIGRELKKNFEERKEAIKKRDENTAERNEAAEELVKEQLTANGKNILKYRLYQQQNGKCIYSGKILDIRKLDDYQVDHILPYSRSLDNSFNNKILCLTDENQKKRNQTPFEYLGPQGKWEEFKTLVMTTPSLGRKKKENLLNESFSNEEGEKKFRERNSNDNAYIAMFVKRYLEDGIDFSASQWTDIKNRIQIRNGSLTDYLRHQWGLEKDRDESDKHHAQDAIVIACATQGMVKYLSTVSGLFENKYKLITEKGEAWYKSLKHKFLEPWNGFREEVLKSLGDVFVSRPPRKKASGEIHAATIYKKDTGKGSLPIRGGMAEKSNMFRMDIFKKGEKYYVVPIFLSDILDENRKDVFYPNKPDAEGNLLVVDASFEFIMTLHKDDYVKIKTDDNNEYEGYIVQVNMPVGQFIIRSSDNAKIFSIRTDTFEKDETIVIGGKHCTVIGCNGNKLQAKDTDSTIHEVEAEKKKTKSGDDAKKAIKTTERYKKADSQKKINIGTFVELKKCQIDILGNISEVGKENRTLVNKKEIRKHKEKIEREQKYGLADCSNN